MTGLATDGCDRVFELSACVFVDARYLGGGVTGAIEPAPDYRRGWIAERI
jgi:hypothetical protein